LLKVQKRWNGRIDPLSCSDVSIEERGRGGNVGLNIGEITKKKEIFNEGDGVLF
jgi:hypothetical protein